MSSVAKSWQFILNPASHRYHSNAILINGDTSVGFPSHEGIKKALAKMGRLDDYDRYSMSPIGLGTTLRGNHIYGVKHSNSDTVILGADSVVRGWLANPSFWEAGFASAYGAPRRKIFLRFTPRDDSEDSYLYNSVRLWKNSDGNRLPVEVEDAMRFTFTGIGRSGGFDEWLKCVTRAKLSPFDIMDGVEKSSVVTGIYSESMINIVNMLSSAERSAGNYLPRDDFAAWMFASTIIREKVDSQGLDLAQYISGVISSSIKPIDFIARFRAGVPLQAIVMSEENGVDIELMASLTQ